MNLWIILRHLRFSLSLSFSFALSLWLSIFVFLRGDNVVCFCILERQEVFFWHKWRERRRTNHGSNTDEKCDKLSSSWELLKPCRSRNNCISSFWWWNSNFLRYWNFQFCFLLLVSFRAIEFQSWSVAYGTELKFFFYYKYMALFWPMFLCCPLMALNADSRGEERWKIASAIRLRCCLFVAVVKNQWLKLKKKADWETERIF